MNKKLKRSYFYLLPLKTPSTKILKTKKLIKILLRETVKNICCYIFVVKIFKKRKSCGNCYFLKYDPARIVHGECSHDKDKEEEISIEGYRLDDKFFNALNSGVLTLYYETMKNKHLIFMNHGTKIDFPFSDFYGRCSYKDSENIEKNHFHEKSFCLFILNWILKKLENKCKTILPLCWEYTEKCDMEKDRNFSFYRHLYCHKKKWESCLSYSFYSWQFLFCINRKNKNCHIPKSTNPKGTSVKEVIDDYEKEKDDKRIKKSNKISYTSLILGVINTFVLVYNNFIK